MDGPHDFPWLGDLVPRERAWRWASQFPRFFGTVEAADRDVVVAFGSTPVATAADARAAMEADGGGATLVVDRGGRKLTVPVAPEPARLVLPAVERR